jgi:hypothetical protein
MAISWSTEELEKIKNQSLKNLRPSYYYLPNKNLMQISEDMEGYLILQDQEQKQKLLSWIKDVTKIETENKDRDALLATYLDIRLEDTQARMDEMDEVLNNYAEMQADLITDGDDPSRFATIMDLNLMTRSISRPVEMITMQRDQAFHEQNVTTALKNTLEVIKSDKDTEKELSSWQTVISAYKGQKGKSGSKKAGKATTGPKT